MLQQFQNILFLVFCVSFWNLKSQVVNSGKLYFGAESSVLIDHDFINKHHADLYNDGLFYLTKNFHNNGTVDFISSTGKTIFSGVNTQRIEGEGTFYLNEVYFDNLRTDDAFQLKTELFIEKAAAFLNGIIDSKNHDGLMVFGDKAQVKTVSNNSFVEGLVEKIGDADFRFPIGAKGVYRPGAISGLSNSRVYGLEYKLEKPPTDLVLKSPDLTYINTKEYWVLETSNNPYEIFLSLSYSRLTSPTEIISAAQTGNLCVAKWDERSGMWRSHGGVLDGEFSSVTAVVNGPGIYTLGACRTAEECDIQVYNLVDVSGASNNNYMRVITACSIIKVSVFNRWGIKVFESENYGLQGDVFDGQSSGRLTLSKKDYLPNGAYLYVIEYRSLNDDHRVRHRTGYVYVKSD